MEASNVLALNINSAFTHQLLVLWKTKLMIIIRIEPLPINKCLVGTNPHNELLKGVISIFKDKTQSFNALPYVTKLAGSTWI